MRGRGSKRQLHNVAVQSGRRPHAPVIIGSFEQSTLASTWTEHLCLHRRIDGKLQLDIRGWEVAGEGSDFWDEETEDYLIPDQIDGVDVIGTEDDYVVIANRVIHSDDYTTFVFEDFDWSGFKEQFDLTRPNGAPTRADKQLKLL